MSQEYEATNESLGCARPIKQVSRASRIEQSYLLYLKARGKTYIYIERERERERD